MLAHAGDDLSDKQQEALPLLIDRLRNEVTRLVAVKVVAEVASSPIIRGEMFDTFIQDSINEVATLLRKSNRVLKLSAFDCLASLLKRSGDHLAAASANLIVTEIEPLLTHESNFTLVPVALQSVNLILASNQAAHSGVQTSILPAIYSMVRSPLLQGPGLEAVLDFLQSMLRVDASLTQDVLRNLMAALQTVKKSSSPSATHINSTVAQCIGAVVKANPSAGASVIESASQVINDASSHTEAELYFNLLVLGEVGRLEDFAKRKALFDKVLSFFEAKAEEVKGAAAFAVGNMSVGNLEAFLPVIEQQMAGGDDRRRLLALSALKELISHGSAQQLSVVANRIWAPLFDICNTTDEATRNLGAECLARLTLTDPARYLPQLQGRLHDPVATTRAAVIAAIRYTLTGKESSQYDVELAPTMVEFLSLLKDDDLDVRRHAMFALNSAAHHKASLIRPHLSVLLPSMYEQTIPRPELLRKVTMGPFTVTMDDGLELRKNAFETMYTLLDTCFGQIKIEELLSRVIAGLTDDDGIKVLCYLMLVRLVALAPAHISQHLDDLVEPMTSTLKVKLRDQATKQEVEKSTELHRAIFRAMIALERLPIQQAQQGGGAAPSSARFEALVREARSGNALYREVENGVRADAVGAGAIGYNGMEIDG
ncbi:hypothetical protein L7F22_034921 [Adiantum nelumboides]|nr:hypothetical protein [Adiantum nelumboides]